MKTVPRSRVLKIESTTKNIKQDSAKKRSAKDGKYYEKHKARILANRKQKYKENAEVEKAASHLRYDADPQPQKTAAHAWSKAKYSANPEPQKTAARAWSKAKYSAKLALNRKRLLHVHGLKQNIVLTLNRKRRLHVRGLK